MGEEFEIQSEEGLLYFKIYREGDFGFFYVCRDLILFIVLFFMEVVEESY